MVTLLTLKPEVQGSNPGAGPPKFGAHLLLSTTPPPGRKDASKVPEWDGVRESQAPGMTKKPLFFSKKIFDFYLACDPKSEFSCSPGVCVPLSSLCAGRADCQLGQDEVGCCDKDKEFRWGSRTHGFFLFKIRQGSHQNTIAKSEVLSKIQNCRLT